MTRRQKNGLLGVLLALSGLIGVSAVDAANPSAGPVPDALASVLLEDGGIITVPLSTALAEKIAVKGVTGNQALATALSAYGFQPKEEPGVYLASVTVLGDYVGDETTALIVEDDPAYVIQMTGLDILPMGGPPVGDETVRPLPHHSEMDILVDAMSGELIMGTTFR